MKRAALIIVVLMALPLAALWAQSDPAYPAATDPQPAQAYPADPANPQPADPQPVQAEPSAPAADPNAVNDPDAEGRALPATSSHGPLILLMGLLAIGMFLVLKVFRGRSVDVS